MIPLKDENPTRTTAFVTMLLMAACIAVYFLVQPTGQTTTVNADAEDQQVREMRFLLDSAAIPQEITSGRPLTEREVSETFPAELGDSSELLCPIDPSPACYPDKGIWRSVLYSMFLHGSLLHLAGNMLFLWVFGNNIEDRRGRATYIVFYVVAGIAATFAQVAVDPDSTIPMIGASGAVAGVMGAYLVLYPNVKIRSLILLGFFILFRDISAKSGCSACGSSASSSSAPTRAWPPWPTSAASCSACWQASSGGPHHRPPKSAAPPTGPPDPT